MDIKTLLMTISLLTLSACGGGSSSSNTAADVTNECRKVLRTNGRDTTYINGCNFAVNGILVYNGNATNILSNVQPNDILYHDFEALRATSTITAFRLCRAPSVASVSGCS